MSSSPIAIKVEGLGKSYNIYNQPQDRLKQSIIPRLQLLAGRQPKRYYREFWALNNISLEVKRGETVGIIGRNGSGKSTLLQLICGTLAPTTGSVNAEGRVTALLELGSGFNPEFTGRENVYLNGAILGLSKNEIDHRFDDIAAFADIGDFIEQPVKMYSSGMVVRLAFAVQAMVDPDILVVDEALAVGDEKFQRKCFARLEELKNNGSSILFVSHSGSQIVELCEHALLLEGGERLLYGQPRDVVRAYQKLIYSPADHQAELVREYKALDHSGTDLRAAHDEIPPFTDSRSAGSDSEPSHTEHNKGQSKEYFDPGLIPETTVTYPVQGGKILSFRILDMDGQEVNCLLLGREYCIEVTGSFLADREKVYLGVHIRTTSGLEIVGQRYPVEGKYIEDTRAGSHFRVKYFFKMLLAPGIYFSGGGIWAIDEPVCLHRIMDAIMFRVIPDKKTNLLGYLDMSLSQPVFETYSIEKSMEKAAYDDSSG